MVRVKAVDGVDVGRLGGGRGVLVWLHRKRKDESRQRSRTGRRRGMWTPDKSVWLAARRDGKRQGYCVLSWPTKQATGRRRRKTGGGRWTARVYSRADQPTSGKEVGEIPVRSTQRSRVVEHFPFQKIETITGPCNTDDGSFFGTSSVN